MKILISENKCAQDGGENRMAPGGQVRKIRLRYLKQIFIIKKLYQKATTFIIIRCRKEKIIYAPCIHIFIIWVLETERTRNQCVFIPLGLFLECSTRRY